jgi:23S rRNA (cytosine1962-C5)-methyltransferase
MVVKPEAFVAPGSIVDVVDRQGAALGCAFYNPRSEIALRMLGNAEEDLVARRLAAALEFRARLGIQADAYRVCHAEGDGLPGLVIDRYADVYSVQVFSLGMVKHLDAVRKALPRTFVQADERSARLEGMSIPAEPPPQGVVIREHGVQFRVDFARGHKTGFFCDQRENRRDVAALCAGKEVLDLCCYTGGFAVSAAKAGAKRVVAVDLDEEALETARQNARLNKVKVDFLHADTFNYLRQSKDRFDVVILDPPKMARDREDLAKGRRAYYDMNRFAARAVRPGGVFVTCSCTGLVQEHEFVEIVHLASERELRTFRISGAGPDHPVSSLYPEGRYLKVIYNLVV